jgi:hypothetical protein
MQSRKAFTRGQTQVLFRHLPGAVFEHDDYGLCRVTEVAQSDIDVNHDALFSAVVDALAMWSSASFAEKFPDPRDMGKRTQYSIGAPREVRFVPYPEVFSCNGCRRVYRFTDLARRGGALDGKCPACSGRLNRLRYVQAHNCGRLEELFVPQTCAKCGARDIAFYDPGRVKQARWYCAKCKADLQSLRAAPCKCAYSQSLPDGSFDRWLRVVPTGDASLFAPHTVAFINFAEDSSGQLRSSPDAARLMLARAWGLLPQPVAKLLQERTSAVKDGGNAALADMVKELRKLDPSNALVKKFDEDQGKPPGQDVIDKVGALLVKYAGGEAPVPRRSLVELTTLLDSTDITSIEDVASILEGSGDTDGAAEIREAKDKAATLLGIREVRVINDFPLALCAFGFTRISRDPARSVISPFPLNDAGKIPVYAMSSETEALWFQLDPVRVVEWLVANDFASGPVPTVEAEAWAWLYGRVPGLQQAPYEPDYGDETAVAIRTLLHTMSHIFLGRIEWSGFSPSSVGEYLMPGSLSFILYANRYAEHKIGGLTTLFEQRLGTWLWDAVQSGRECVYDPICTDDGGSCAGCTHREHNCVSFNRELSRATTYGGPTPEGSELRGRPISKGYWHDAWKAAPTL